MLVLRRYSSCKEEEEDVHADVFVLLQCTSDVSRQRGEWDNYTWIEWTRLVEVDRQLLDRVDLVVEHHQPLRTIRTHLLGI